MSEQSSVPVYRYAYTSKRDSKRYVVRVTIYERIVKDDIVMLMLRAVGAWPDRDDLAKLAATGIPMCAVIILAVEDEDEWRGANLKAEEGQWAA